MDQQKILTQLKCLNKECKTDALPVRFSIVAGEVQSRCRVCKEVTQIRCKSGEIIFATVIRQRREECEEIEFRISV
jgi:hypothetical protein